MHPSRLAERVSHYLEERLQDLGLDVVAPISLFPREDGEWLMAAVAGGAAQAGRDRYGQLSAVAQDLHHALHERGAKIFADRVRLTSYLSAEVEAGRWVLRDGRVVTGFVSASRALPEAVDALRRDRSSWAGNADYADKFSCAQRRGDRAHGAVKAA